MNAAPSAPALKPEFDGKRILLTGATGSIGRATALRLAEAGAHVVLNGRDQAKLEKIAEILPNNTFSLSAFNLDQSDEIPNWVRGLAEKDGPLAGLAHTAGIQATRPIRSINTDFIAKILHTNVTTAIM